MSESFVNSLETSYARRYHCGLNAQNLTVRTYLDARGSTNVQDAT